MTTETRTVVAQVAPDLLARRDYTDDMTRLAYFRQSAATVAGKAAPFRWDEYVQHEKTDEPTSHN